jgi:ATP-binding cassette subfamily B protein
METRMETRWREDFPKSKSPFSFFLFASRPHWRAALITVVAVSAGAVFSSLIAYVFKLITNAASALSTGQGSYEALFFAASGYVLFLLAAKALWRIGDYALMRWATGARAIARQSLTAYVTLHSRAYFSDHFAGSLATDISHAATGMVEVAEQLCWEFLELGVSVIVSFFIAYAVSPRIAWTFLAWVAVAAALNFYLGRRRVPLAARAQALESGLTGMTVDLLSNITTMQEYARRGYEMGRFKKAITGRRLAGARNWTYGITVAAFNNALQFVFGGAMVYIAVTLLKGGLISVGDIVLVMTVIFRIEGYLQRLGTNLNKLSNVWGEIAESLNEILLPHEIPDRDGAGDLAVPRGAISFKEASFRYGALPVFENLDFTIQAGERVGLVGRSGAGKSTLVRLLLHHHDLSGGRITIDGTDIATVSQESLRRAISFVPQEPLLFHRSIRENISYGKPEASEKEIIHAAKLAEADEFIRRLPDGYASMVGERGVKLSGGERQRIAIARAILKDAPILLLDEATSSLDSESEVAIQRALHALMAGKTVIAIAHRLSTLR